MCFLTVDMQSYIYQQLWIEFILADERFLFPCRSLPHRLKHNKHSKQRESDLLTCLSDPIWNLQEIKKHVKNYNNIRMILTFSLWYSLKLNAADEKRPREWNMYLNCEVRRILPAPEIKNETGHSPVTVCSLCAAAPSACRRWTRWRWTGGGGSESLSWSCVRLFFTPWSLRGRQTTEGWSDRLDTTWSKLSESVWTTCRTLLFFTLSLFLYFPYSPLSSSSVILMFISTFIYQSNSFKNYRGLGCGQTSDKTCWVIWVDVFMSADNKDSCLISVISGDIF